MTEENEQSIVTEDTQQNEQCCYHTDLDHLPTTKVLQLLSSATSDENITTIVHPPVNPKGGDVYLFSYGHDKNKEGQCYHHAQLLHS